MITINPSTGEKGVYNRTPNPANYSYELIGEKVIVICNGKITKTEIVKQTDIRFWYIFEKAEHPYLDDEIKYGYISFLRKVNGVFTYNTI
jgi:hypothetical protein